MDVRKTAEKRANETAREAAGRIQQSSSKAAEGLREYQLKLLSPPRQTLTRSSSTLTKRYRFSPCRN